MQRYKVLNVDLISPFQMFPFKLGEKYHCEDFDESEKECSNGFYATDLNGLIYTFNTSRKIFLCEVSGKSKEINQFKMRYENIEIIREVSHEEIKKLLLENKIDEKEGYKYTEAMFPINPFLVKRGEVTEEEIALLKEWASVRDSICNSVGASVWDSVWASVWDSVGASICNSIGDSVGYPVGASVRYPVGDSVWDSVWAYISSLFPQVKFKYDFSSCAKLWKTGLVPSYDGKTWRLHSGKDATIVYTLT